jgi:flagellar hook-associated protein 1 FlgK
MSLITGLHTGVSGIKTAQAALNTTAHNLANTETTGYTRQQLLSSDTVYVEGYLGTRYGLGTTSATIRQIRDNFMDKAYRTENSRAGFYEAQNDTVTEIEDLFGELEGVEFQTSLNDMWCSMQELQKEPESLVTRSTFLQTCTSFLERSQNIYNQMSEYQAMLNNKVVDTVNRINEIGQEIIELNQKINKYEFNGQEANDYKDQRNNLLDELSGYVKISYKDGLDGVEVNIEGMQFITGVIENKLEIREIEREVTYENEDGETVTGMQGTGLYDVYWSGLNAPKLYANLEYSSKKNSDMGSLKGILISRGTYNANYTDIPIRPQEEEYTDEYGNLDEDAYNEAKEEYAAKLEKYEESVKPSMIMRIQAEFDQLVHKIVTKINDVLCPNVYDEGLEAYVLDTENCPVGMDEEMTMGEGIFNRKSVSRYTKVEDGDETLYVYNGEDEGDNYTLFTITELEINSAVMDDFSKIPLSRQGNTGDYEMDTCADLLDIWDNADMSLGPDDYTINTFMEYYNAMVSDIANEGSTMRVLYENQEGMTENVEAQRNGLSGVSGDEELTHLIKYQQAYNAASRYITVVDQMIQYLLEKVGA